MQDYKVIFTEFLMSKGLKLTKPREIILDAVFATHDHFNVDTLYDQIKQHYTNVSRATIYRTMPLLLEAGLIKQSPRYQAKEHYEHIYGHKQHIHFVCTQCGKIMEEESKEVEQVLTKLAHKIKFEIKEFNAGALGLCHSCQK